MKVILAHALTCLISNKKYVVISNIYLHLLTNDNKNKYDSMSKRYNNKVDITESGNKIYSIHSDCTILLHTEITYIILKTYICSD